MKAKTKQLSIVAICIAAAIFVSGFIAAQASSAPRGTQGATRFYRMDETAESHPFTTIASSPAYDRGTFIDLAPLFLEHEGLYVSICKGYAIKLVDEELASELGLDGGGDPARDAATLYCENGTARVFYGRQYNSVSVEDFVFKVDGVWYMAWFSSSYSREMLHMLSIIASR